MVEAVCLYIGGCFGCHISNRRPSFSVLVHSLTQFLSLSLFLQCFVGLATGRHHHANSRSTSIVLPSTKCEYVQCVHGSMQLHNALNVCVCVCNIVIWRTGERGMIKVCSMFRLVCYRQATRTWNQGIIKCDCHKSFPTNKPTNQPINSRNDRLK